MTPKPGALTPAREEGKMRWEERKNMGMRGTTVRSVDGGDESVTSTEAHEVEDDRESGKGRGEEHGC